MFAETEYAGHARRIAHTIDFGTLDGIVCVSGDGLLYEVMNGLFSRSDWEVASQMPVGAIPAGSGNGLASALQSPTPIEAALAVARGYTTRLDLFSLLQGGERHFCFLSFTYGLIANIDVGTDNLRGCLGTARFDYGGLREVVKASRYGAQYVK